MAEIPLTEEERGIAFALVVDRLTDKTLATADDLVKARVTHMGAVADLQAWIMSTAISPAAALDVYNALAEKSGAARDVISRTVAWFMGDGTSARIQEREQQRQLVLRFLVELGMDPREEDGCPS